MTRSQIEMTCFNIARIGRLDPLWTVNNLARFVTKWSRTCDKRLARHVNYIYHKVRYKQCCLVGNMAIDCRLGIIQDADLAGICSHSKSTSSGVLWILLKPFHARSPCCCLTHGEVSVVSVSSFVACLINDARRNARLPAQRATPEVISLGDDDTDSLVSTGFECAVCGEQGASIHIPCCSYAPHRVCIDDGVDAFCPYCQRDVCDVVDAAAVQCQLCDSAVDMGADSVSFTCCPQSAFHLFCVAPVASVVDNQVGCPVCIGERREHASALWFERLCHTNGVQWPVESGHSGQDVECSLCCESMLPDDSILVPCCQHRLHVRCLSPNLQRPVLSRQQPSSTSERWMSTSLHPIVA